MRKPAKKYWNDANMAVDDFKKDSPVVAQAMTWTTFGVFLIGVGTVAKSAVKSALWIRRRRKTAKV